MPNLKLYFKKYRAILLVFAVVFAATPLLIVGEQKGRCGYVMLVMGVCWVTEAVPISITALLPMFFLPVLGLVPAKTVASKYIKDSTLMFTGGLIMAAAVEKVDLHRHLALNFLLFVGQQPHRLMLGFSLIGWFLSMWISNTATIAMLLPCVEAVLDTLQTSSADAQVQTGDVDVELQEPEADKVTFANEEVEYENNASKKETIPEKVSLTEDVEYKLDNTSKTPFRNLAKALTLATVYCSKTGGMATLTGTPPTVIMKGLVDEWWLIRDAGDGPITFPTWVVVGLPVSFLFLLAAIYWLQIFYFGIRATFCPSSSVNPKVRNMFLLERDALGRLQFQQKIVLALFTILVLMWFFRDPGFMPGWASHLKKGYITDAVPAIIIPFFLFMIPTELSHKAGPILDWRTIHEKFPWMVIWLLGGGFALADASMKSGLSSWFGSKLMTMSGMPNWCILGIICFLVSLLTEVTSNSATVTMLMPIMAGFGEALGLNPLYMMWPVTLAAEFAFMLPTSSPSGALALTTGRVKILDMIKAGFVLNVIGVIIVVIAAHSWGWVYFDHGTIPYTLPRLASNITFPINETITV